MSPTTGPLRRDIGGEMRSAARRGAERSQRSGMLVLAMVLAAVLMAGFIVLDYQFDQAEHRLFKILAGLLAIAGILSQPHFGLLILPVATPFLPWVPPAPIPGLNPVNLLLFSIFGTYAIGRIARRQEVFRKGRLDLWIGGLILLAAVSILRGAAFPTGLGFDAGSAGLVLFRSSTTFATYFIVHSMVRGLPERRRVTWAVVIGLLAEAIVTLMYGRNGSGGRALGTLGQSNELGAFLALFAVVCVPLIPATRNLLGRIILLGTFIATCIALFMSLSRGSMVALVAALAIVCWRTSRALFAILVVTLLLSPLWAPDYLKDRISGSQMEVAGSDEVSMDMAAEARVQTWRSIMEVVQAHPIEGVGWTGLGYVLPDIGTELGLEDVKDSAHNTFLRMLGEMGVLGFALFCALLWQCWSLSARATRLARDPFDKALAIGVGGAVVSMAVSCAFGDRFFNVIIASNFWVLMALVEDSLSEAGGPRA